jgi:hypothetical protein
MTDFFKMTMTLFRKMKDANGLKVFTSLTVLRWEMKTGKNSSGRDGLEKKTCFFWLFWHFENCFYDPSFLKARSKTPKIQGRSPGRLKKNRRRLFFQKISAPRAFYFFWGPFFLSLNPLPPLYPLKYPSLRIFKGVYIYI